MLRKSYATCPRLNIEGETECGAVTGGGTEYFTCFDGSGGASR